MAFILSRLQCVILSRLQCVNGDFLDDPYEENDLSTALPDITKELTARLNFYMNDVARPLWPEPETKSHPSWHNGTISSGWCTLEFLSAQRRESLANSK